MSIVISILYLVLIFVVLYYLIKAAVRQGIIEAQVKNKKLTLQTRLDDLYTKIVSLANTNYQQYKDMSKEDVQTKKQAFQKLSQESFQIYNSSQDNHAKLTALEKIKQSVIKIQHEIMHDNMAE